MIYDCVRFISSIIPILHKNIPFPPSVKLLLDSVPVSAAVIADPVKVLFALVDVARVWFCAAVIHLLTRRESAGMIENSYTLC